MSLWQASRLLKVFGKEEVMDTWVVCPKELFAWIGTPGEPCVVCNAITVEAPLMPVASVVSEHGRNCLCDECVEAF